MSEIPPTRMNQQVYKGKKKAAVSGHKLLKKKADALKVKFRDYAKMIADTKGHMSSDASAAFFSLTQAEYAAGNFKQKVTEGTYTARVRIGAGIENVAGVKLPVFKIYDTNVNVDNQSLGLVRGGKKIAATREKFSFFLNQLIKLASLQTSFITLDQAMKVTNRRVNALENVTIPKIQYILDYIARELDEFEREDFTRLKLVQSKKAQSLVRNATEQMKKLLIETNDVDITARYDAQDDDDVVF